MGQVKQRGTFEQRRAESIIKYEESLKLKRAAELQKLREETYEDKQKRIRALKTYAMFTGLIYNHIPKSTHGK